MPATLFNGRLARVLDRHLGGTNLEVAKFGLYILFPIGYMYYFGTNLDNRFGVPDFWPRAEQTNKIPFERDEIGAELARLRERRLARREERLAREEGREVRRGEARAEREVWGRMEGGYAQFGGEVAR